MALHQLLATIERCRDRGRSIELGQRLGVTPRVDSERHAYGPPEALVVGSRERGHAQPDRTVLHAADGTVPGLAAGR